MLRRAGLSVAQLHGSASGSVVRHFRLAAAAAQQQKLDPIQEIFLNKTREYASKSKAAGGAAVEMSEADKKAMSDEMERVDRIYGAGPDFMKIPTFSFTDPELEPVGVDMKPKEVVEEVKKKKDKWTRDPDELWTVL